MVGLRGGLWDKVGWSRVTLRWPPLLLLAVKSLRAETSRTNDAPTLPPVSFVRANFSREGLESFGKLHPLLPNHPTGPRVPNEP